jgi:hypothetical protein
MTDKGKPESGKTYALTGGTGAACIANGNTWAESEVVGYTLSAEDIKAAAEKTEKDALCEIPEFLKRSA